MQGGSSHCDTAEVVSKGVDGDGNSGSGSEFAFFNSWSSLFLTHWFLEWLGKWVSWLLLKLYNSEGISLSFSNVRPDWVEMKRIGKCTVILGHETKSVLIGEWDSGLYRRYSTRAGDYPQTSVPCAHTPHSGVCPCTMSCRCKVGEKVWRLGLWSCHVIHETAAESTMKMSEMRS